MTTINKNNINSHLEWEKGKDMLDFIVIHSRVESSGSVIAAEYNAVFNIIPLWDIFPKFKKEEFHEK